MRKTANDEDLEHYKSVRSVERAISLLESLERTRHSMRLIELANDVGISSATARRLLLVLAAKGLVQRERDRYQIGYGVVSMANACLMESLLRRVAQQPAAELAALTQQTVSLYVRQGFQRIIILRAEGTFNLSFQTPIGERLPLHLGAGKVLAAGMSDTEIQSLVESLPENWMPHDKSFAAEEFFLQINGIRKKGFYISKSERKKYTISITMPILSPTGETIAALSVISMLDKNDEESMMKFLPHVQSAAISISESYFRD